MGLRVYIATSNAHKIAEARAVLGEYGIELEPVKAVKLEVQSDSLEEIALRAARTAYSNSRASPLIVEDAGLFIYSLNGFPGPYTSYAYKTIGLEGVLRLLEGSRDRRARFVSAVAVIEPPLERVFVGVAEGYIAAEPRGGSGFGFDPIFIPEGSRRTFAEMSLEEKNKYSHRAKALRMAAEWLLSLRG